MISKELNGLEKRIEQKLTEVELRIVVKLGLMIGAGVTVVIAAIGIFLKLFGSAG